MTLKVYSKTMKSERELEMVNGWKEWGKHVLAEISRLSDEVNELRKDIHKVDKDITMLKVKSSFWGGLAGFGAGLITLIISLLKS